MRTLSVVAVAALLAGCAGTPRLEEVATVECEASASTGDVRNCVLISQTIEGSEFGAFAVEAVAKGKLKPSTEFEGWQKFRVQIRKQG